MTEIPTTAFRNGDRVRMTHDFGTSMAVQVGAEGVVIDASSPQHIVVDFGKWDIRGCRSGEHLEKLNHGR